MNDSKQATQTVDLAAWLTRIWDEEERRATAATEGPWLVALHADGRILGIDAHDGYDEVITTGNVNCMSHCYGGTSTIVATNADWRFIARNNPASVLARIAADRKILELHAGGVSYPDECGLCNEALPCETVRLLASPYKGREGWQEAWE